jgi:hypothetical protein
MNGSEAIHRVEPWHLVIKTSQVLLLSVENVSMAVPSLELRLSSPAFFFLFWWAFNSNRVFMQLSAFIDQKIALTHV